MSYCDQCERASVAEGRSPFHADTMPAGYCGLARLCDKGTTVHAICEGCGEIEVDHLGRCQNECSDHADAGYP